MPIEALYNEKELLSRAAEGSEAAFTQLFHAHKDRLYTFLMRLTGSPEATEDIIQDVFLKLWAMRDKLDDIDRFGSYLLRMSQNQVLNAFKRMSKQTLILAELKRQTGFAITGVDEQLEQNIEQRQVQQKLQAAIESLTPQQKMIYSLSREANMKYEEIAEQLQISPNTVKNHMVMALKAIREHLGQHLHTVAGASIVLAIIEAFQK